MPLTKNDLYQIRYGAAQRDLREPSVVMHRDTYLDALIAMDPPQKVERDEVMPILGMPVKIDMAVPRGQIRLEDSDGRRYPVMLEITPNPGTEWVHFQKKGPPR